MVYGRICSSIIKESAGKSLAGHFLKDGRPEFSPDPGSCKDAWASFGLLSVWAFYVEMLG